MKRRAFLTSALSAGVSACRRDPRPRLNVYNWSAYVAPDTIPNFEKEYGVRVRYVTYESNEEMLAQVVSGNSGWDIVFPTHNRVPPMSAMGLIAPLDRRRLKNLGNLEPQFQSPSWDRDLRWSIPYVWFGSGIAFNRSVAPRCVAWADLWNPRLKGRLTMLDVRRRHRRVSRSWGCCLNPLTAISSTAPSKRSPEQKPAGARLSSTRGTRPASSPAMFWWRRWSTTAAKPRCRAGAQFCFSRRRLPLYCDCAVILRESCRQELAHQFLDYILRPRVSAGIAQATLTATANGAARATLPEKIRSSPALYPPPDVMQRGQWPGTLPAAAQRLRDRIWTEVKAA
jgi:spermidine/putrescine transport system substrate-binding protein